MTAGAPHEVSSLEELQQLAELVDVVYYEVSGRRTEGFDASDGADEEMKAAGDDRADIRLMQRMEGNRLAVRTRALVVTSEGRLVADVAALFRTPEPVRIPAAVAKRFAAVIATPVTRPYLREAIHQSAVKLGIAAPVLPVLDLEDIGLLPPAQPPTTP
ncbi:MULTISPECIES: hypothetical protein [unclassified Streptomyces]|uniref:hypothetical protein n=1 Tax=unclassified Streptomyces TaxID=2593676 RepID=UPI0004CAC62B|nr:hypothetical protein [Streptomyces sp. NRRL F-5630]